jgi:hypothetical protein
MRRNEANGPTLDIYDDDDDDNNHNDSPINKQIPKKQITKQSTNSDHAESQDIIIQRNCKLN